MRALILTRDPKLERSLQSFVGDREWEAVTAGDLEEAQARLENGGQEVAFLDARLWGERWEEQTPRLAALSPSCRFVVIASQGDGGNGNTPDSLPSNLSVLVTPFQREELDEALGEGPRRPRNNDPPAQSAPRPRDPTPRLPIRVKITLPFVLLAFALAVGFAFAASRLILDTVEERYTNQLIEAGRLVNEWMVIEENRMLGTARALARTEGMSAAVKAGDRERVRRLALPIAVNAGEEAVELLDQQGRSVVSMRRGPDAPREDYEFTTGADLTQFPFVPPVLSGVVDERGDKRAGLARADWGLYFYVAAPIYDAESEVVGAVLVGRSGISLVRGMRQATLAQISAYTPSGESLASTLLEPRPLEGLRVNRDQPLGQNSYTRSLEVANIEYREILGPWEVRGEEQIGLLGIALPESFLVRASRWTRLQIGGFVAVGFVLVIVVGYLVSNHITYPLLQLVHAARKVADGNLGVQVRPRGNDEVASLASTFNDMVSSLRKSRIRLINAYDSTLVGWSKALELRDNDTEGHTRRVVEMSTKLALAMNVDRDQIVHLRRGAILHDIGKMGIPDGILRKPAPLSEAEWETMRKHPVYAQEMLAHIDYLRPAMAVPRHHHEWWDGSGYPDGLKGEEIPLAARIFSVADVCDALLSDRPYRPAWTVDQTLKYIRSMRGKQFDPAVVDTFLRMVADGELTLKQHGAKGNGRRPEPGDG